MKQTTLELVSETCGDTLYEYYPIGQHILQQQQELPAPLFRQEPPPGSPNRGFRFMLISTPDKIVACNNPEGESLGPPSTRQYKLYEYYPIQWKMGTDLFFAFNEHDVGLHDGCSFAVVET
jgi:hypothetical protein